MTEDQITIAAGALADSIRAAARRQGLAKAETLTLTSIAFVAIMGEAHGPRGLVDFPLSDWASARLREALLEHQSTEAA